MASIASTALAATPSTDVEFLRLEKLPTGHLIAVRQIPSHQNHYLNLTFKLSGFDATDSAHMAIGLGDLYRYYDAGKAPVGDGFVIGESGGCLDKGVAVNFESYGGEIPGKTLDCPTAYGPLNQNTVYQIRLTVTPSGDVDYALRLLDDTLIATGHRSWNGQHAAHERGLFIIPYSPAGKPNGSYELLTLKAGYWTP